MAQLCVLFEHATGYSLFKVAEYEDSKAYTNQIQKSVFDLNAFKSIADIIAFQPFTTGRDALENMNSVSEGILHPHLQQFLENNLPKTKKKRPLVLGVGEPKLAAVISEVFGISCLVSGAVPEVIRGIRLHFHNLVTGIKDLNSANKAQLGLGHHYSRARVKFNVNKIDNMIIQSINIVDQLDKDINTFSMRIREWYSFHFPELVKIVPENNLYIRCVRVIRDRKLMPDDIEETLENILMDKVKAQGVLELARNSMGMEISTLDMDNVTTFAERVCSLMTRRKELMEYLKSKMHAVAPNLATLIGETVGARLIAHAGSLINLAKFPASTVQILGAEKALFRALKTRGNTPKYGLIYHSTFIGRASKANKGRISRYLANKCSVASRIDCFREIPTEVFGTKLRQQVEDRLKFYDTGDIPEKNVDVMTSALEEADIVAASLSKEKKKADKKEKKRKSLQLDNISQNSINLSAVSTDEAFDTSLVVSEKKKKKKKRSIQNDEDMLESNDNEVQNTEELAEANDMNEVDPDDEAAIAKAKRKALKKERKRLLSLQSMSENSFNISTGGEYTTGEETSLIDSEKKKKKKRKISECESAADVSQEEMVEEACNGDISIKKKKKKKKKHQEVEED